MQSLLAVVAASLIFVTTVAVVQCAARSGLPPTVISIPAKMAWVSAPPSLPRGAELAVVEGDPTTAGAFAMRLRMPDGYRIPVHFHPVVEHVTVLQGTFRVGMGDRFDPTTLSDLPTGSFAALAPGAHYFAQAEGETVIQLHGIGPWRLTYVSPVDDPRNQGR